MKRNNLTVLAVLVTALSAAAQVSIEPGNPMIRTVGRFTDDFTFNWSGCLIEFETDATTVAVKLEMVADNAAGFEVVVDGEARFLKTVPGRTRYALAEGLAPGRHRIQLFKRSESTMGTVRFQGLELSDGAQLFPVPAPERRMLVIGDSITCGYGNEEPDRKKGNTVENENGYLAYAPIAARNLNADLMMICRSGHGLFRNRTINNDRENTLPQLFERTLWLDENTPWDHSRFVPDVVIINLGTNDNSTRDGAKPALSKEEFAGAYVQFINRIRETAPDAHIVLSIGPMTLKPISDWLPEIAAQFENTSVLTYARMTGDSDIGGHWHPSVSKHWKMSRELLNHLRSVTDWK